MSEEKKRSEKHETARNSLPSDLVSVFDEMVGDYQYAAQQFHNTRPLQNVFERMI